MTERVALITGGARGIGKGIALDLARDQWSVAICYRSSEGDAADTKKAIEDRGGRALAIKCDVSDPIAAADLVKYVEGTWGRIDVLINGAGPYHRVNLFQETPAGWSEMFTNNLHPILYLAQAVATWDEGTEIRAYHFVQYGQRRQNGSSTARDRPLYCQGGCSDSHSDIGQNVGSGWNHCECDLTRIYRLRQCASGGIRWDGQKSSGGIHWRSERYGFGR